MMFNNTSTLCLTLTLPDGTRHVRCFDTTLFKMFSYPEVEGMQLGALPGGFSEAVEILKTRQFRRDDLQEIAKQLANAMADHLEDAEGWHGESRRRRIEGT